MIVPAIKPIRKYRVRVAESRIRFITVDARSEHEAELISEGMYESNLRFFRAKNARSKNYRVRVSCEAEQIEKGASK